MKLTLKQASDKLGITVKALRYRIKAQGLEPEMEDGIHGKRYVLNEDQMTLLGTLPSATDEDAVRNYSSSTQDRSEESREARHPQDPESAQYRFQDPAQERFEQRSMPSIPVDIYKHTQEALREALALSREQREDRLEAERKAEEAQENAMRMAYRVQELTHELNSQRNLLSENAESLVEKQAKVKELEDFEAQEKAKLEELERQRREVERKLQEAEESARKATEEAQERSEKLKAAEAELEARKERDRWPFWKRWFS